MPLPLPPRSTKSETKKSQSTKVRPSDHGQTEKSGDNYQGKKSPHSPHGALKKRSAFEDLTNASQSQCAQSKNEVNKECVKGVSRKINRNSFALGLARNNEMSMKRRQWSSVDSLTSWEDSQAMGFGAKAKERASSVRCKLEPSPASITTTTTTTMISDKEKPLIAVKSVISEAPMTEGSSFPKKPLVPREEFTTEETACMNELLSLKKCKNPGEVPISEKPLSLLKETDHGDASDVDLGKHKTEEAAVTKSAYQGKQSCQGEESVVQDISIQEDPVFMEPVTFRKKPKTEKSSPNKMNRATQEKMTSVKNSLELQKATYKEKSLIKEPLSFKRKPTTEKSLSQEPPIVEEMHTNQGKAPLLKKSGALQKSADTKEEAPLVSASFEEKNSTNESGLTKKQLSLKKKKCATQMMMPTCQELPHNIDKEKDSFFMEPASFRKTPSIKEAVLAKTSVSLKKEITQGKMFHLEKTASEEKSLCEKLLTFKKKPTTEEENLSVLKEKQPTLQEVPPLKKPLVLQESTTKEKSYIKDPLTLEKPPTKECIHLQGSFSLPVKFTSEDGSLFWKGLGLQKIDTKDDSLKKLLALQEKSTTEEESLCKKLLVLKDELSAEEATNREKQLSFKKKSTFQEEKKKEVLQEIIASGWGPRSKYPLTLQEKPSTEEGALPKESLALKVMPSIKQKTNLGETLGLQKEVSSEKTFKEPWTSQETATDEEEVILKESLALQEKPSSEKKAIFKVQDTSLNGTLTQQVENSPHVPSINLLPGTSKYNTTTMLSVDKLSTTTVSIVGKPSTASKSSGCESSSNKSSSSQGERSQMTPLEDIDMEDHNNPLFSSVYANDIFGYMRKREEKFILRKYMTRQTDINSDMRAILVDWLVEVQMTFEVSHETLYLAVKLVDHYLMAAICKKEKLQLLGSTAFLIAAKFEEATPPCLDDFLYICNDIYQRNEMLSMEMRILEVLNFDINIPTAYHFLRRYARCVHASMQTLTLSRFICEMTLQEYDYVQERASKLAAGCFLLALHMKNLGHWVPTLENYSGYKTSDLRLLVRHLNILLTWRSGTRLNTVRTKYSHQAFFEVTKVPPLEMLKLEEILNNG
ncbi:PREDICTED: G2/mitotic-specific cyclin-B3 [Condylura cristata]|uniref:G2/mitotic-specific cyclin-B3 n=1 Tax=Condylura cristata TaxID=143302 RepID=UPI0006438CFB|nr:PREDICTED: G2/mitotic-specific cyclin-B3 [Condylura cristata]